MGYGKEGERGGRREGRRKEGRGKRGKEEEREGEGVLVGGRLSVTRHTNLHSVSRPYYISVVGSFVCA